MSAAPFGGSQAVQEQVKASPVELALARVHEALLSVRVTADRLFARMDRAGVLGPPEPGMEPSREPSMESKGVACTTLPDKLGILTRAADGTRVLLQDCLDRALI